MPIEAEVGSVRHFTFTELRNFRRKINERLTLSGTLTKMSFFSFECLFVYKIPYKTSSEWDAIAARVQRIFYIV